MQDNNKDAEALFAEKEKALKQEWKQRLLDDLTAQNQQFMQNNNHGPSLISDKHQENEAQKNAINTFIDDAFKCMHDQLELYPSLKNSQNMLIMIEDQLKQALLNTYTLDAAKQQISDGITNEISKMTKMCSMVTQAQSAQESVGGLKTQHIVGNFNQQGSISIQSGPKQSAKAQSL